MNLARIVAQTIQTAATVGLGGSLQLTRPATVDPLTGAQTDGALAFTCRAVVDNAMCFREAPNSAWASATLGVQVAASECPFAPSVGDLVTYGDHSTPIVAMTVIAPTGVPVSYVLGLGG